MAAGDSRESADLGVFAGSAPYEPEWSGCQVLDGDHRGVVPCEDGNAGHRDVHDSAMRATWEAISLMLRTSWVRAMGAA